MRLSINNSFLHWLQTLGLKIWVEMSVVEIFCNHSRNSSGYSSMKSKIKQTKSAKNDFKHFVCLFSTVMHSPGPAFQECTGCYHENVPTQKTVSSICDVNRWSDIIGYRTDTDRPSVNITDR